MYVCMYVCMCVYIYTHTHTGSLFYLTNTIHHFHAITPAQVWMGHTAAVVDMICEMMSQFKTMILYKT